MAGENYNPGITPEDDGPGNAAAQDMKAMLAQVTADERARKRAGG
jgi:hypothetical protein